MEERKDAPPAPHRSPHTHHTQSIRKAVGDPVRGSGGHLRGEMKVPQTAHLEIANLAHKRSNESKLITERVLSNRYLGIGNSGHNKRSESN